MSNPLAKTSSGHYMGPVDISYWYKVPETAVRRKIIAGAVLVSELVDKEIPEARAISYKRRDCLVRDENDVYWSAGELHKKYGISKQTLAKRIAKRMPFDNIIYNGKKSLRMARLSGDIS